MIMGEKQRSIGVFECWRERRLKVPDGSLLDGLACISPDLDLSAAKQTIRTSQQWLWSNLLRCSKVTHSLPYSAVSVNCFI